MVELEATLLSVRSVPELRALLRTVFTPTEIAKFRTRWKACQLAAAGATQRDISKKLRVGVATATRAAKALRENDHIVRLLLSRAKA
jgi:TrpR family trp operon transcriptional repressor